MKCPSCNFNNLSASRFCGQCGTPLPPEEPPIAKPKRKMNGKALLFSCAQGVIFLVLSAISVCILFLNGGVRVFSAFDKDCFKDFSLFNIATDLMTGGEGENPTAVSIIMGLTVILLAFGTAVLWLATLTTKIVRRFHQEIHSLTLVFTGLNIVCLPLLIPLANRFSGVLVQTCAKNANLMLEDVGSIRSIWAIVFSVLCLGLVVAEILCGSKEKHEKHRQSQTPVEEVTQ